MRVFLGRSQREKDEKSGSSDSLVDEERKVSAEEQQQASPDVDERRWSRKRPRSGRSTSPRSNPFEGCDPPGVERPHKRRDRGEEHSDQEPAGVNRCGDIRGSGPRIPRESSVERPDPGRKMGGGGRLIEPACERRKKGDGPERSEGDDGRDEGRGEASNAASSSGAHAVATRGDPSDHRRSVGGATSFVYLWKTADTCFS